MQRPVHVLLLVLVAALAARASDPLPSWNDGAVKASILAFVAEVTTEGSPRHLAPSERVAVFDNDGTLWCEQPLYVQLRFALDRIAALAPQHPEWKQQEPFRSVLAGDLAILHETGEKGVAQIIAATHAGLTTDEFAAVVEAWLATARHPRYGRAYDECVYQPMLELLALLRAHGFKTFIVSGGGTDFMRVFAEQAYDIPPEQVVGSHGAVRFELRDGEPVLVKEREIAFVDDGPGKPVGIHRSIGRRPQVAAGNSDGDLQMLQLVAAREPSLVLLVHHTDERREVAYDRGSSIGRLDAALDEAEAQDWTIVDMARDWKRVFPFETP